MKAEIQCNEIDYVRYIGIFFVILGHMNYTENNVFIKNFIYLFHMPLFFLISGMLIKRNAAERRKLLNSVIGLIIIYVLYNLPYFTNKENIIRVFTFDWMPNIATWFFITMACVKILCFNMNKRKGIALLIISIAIITWMHYAFLDNQNYLLKSVCMALPFYVIGYLCNNILPPYLQVYATIRKKSI